MVERRLPIIVEIGPGVPIFVSSERVGKRITIEGGRYIGIDHNRHSLLVRGLARIGVVGELNVLPLPDQCAEEVWVMNVFNDRENRQKLAPIERTDGTVWNGELYTCMQELVRITRPSGKIYIGEYYEGEHDNLRLLKQINEELDLEIEVHEGVRVYDFLATHRANRIIGIVVDEGITKNHLVFFMTLSRRQN